MEMTFLTIHDLSPSAIILYASDSIEDVLGYEPIDVVGKSWFEYFHPDQLPLARSKDGKSIHFNNAAVLAHVCLKNNQNEWIKCECVFTLVYDVFIAATTLYKASQKSYGTSKHEPRGSSILARAQAAPTIKRRFERPRPLDPRYQMIDHLAPKFRTTSIVRAAVHEPRAAFLLNRFSETLPILYATQSAQDVLSCNLDEAVGRSFYEYIDKHYLLGAVNAIERAKENDSIAYLRLLWKTSIDPLPDDDDEDLMDGYDYEEEEEEEDEQQQQEPGEREEGGEEEQEEVQEEVQEDQPRPSRAFCSFQEPSRRPPIDRYEVECFVSCSSDGLLVAVRRAPPIEGLPPDVRPPGVFAAPWAVSPVHLNTMTPPPPSPVELLTTQESIPPATPSHPRPSDQDIMNCIQDVAVFVWSISMLNDQVSNDNVNNLVIDEFDTNVGNH